MADLHITAWERLTAIPGMLLFGTGTVVISKIVLETKAAGRWGKVHAFEKPWWMVLMMFVGMMSCLVVYWIQTCGKKKNRPSAPDQKQPLLQESGVQENQTLYQKYKDYIVIFPPAMCDMTATGLMYIGLIWVSASIYQLMRGSMVLFSAVLSRIFLKRKIHNHMIIGISLIIGALCMVGVACVKSDTDAGKQSTPAQQILGIGLIVGAQLVQASQIVVEQFLLQELVMTPALIVGTEGFWGTIVTSFVLLPIMQAIPGAEDTIDTLDMMGADYVLDILLVVYIIFILFYNLYGMRVTQQNSAVVRTILEAIRTACIWVTDLFIYYVITKKFGEKWVVWSWLELGGFVILLFGNWIYNRVIELPCIAYPSKNPPPPVAAEPPKEEQK